MICDLCEEQPISPFIFMMNAGGGDDGSYDRPEEGPLGVDRSEIGRDSREPEVVVQSDGEAVQVPRCMPCPRTPHPDIVARHNLTHLPYANWCPHCLAARRANNPHFQKDETFRRSNPLLVMDYCFIRNINDEDLVTCLVGKLYPYNKFFGCVVDVKGPDPYAVARLSDFIREAGLTKFVYKCDQESSVRALGDTHARSEVNEHIQQMIDEAAKRAGRSAQYVNSDDARIIVPEHSAVGESQSNGKAERAVQQVEDQVRTIKSALESRIGAKIPSSHPVVL